MESVITKIHIMEERLNQLINNEEEVGNGLPNLFFYCSLKQKLRMAFVTFVTKITTKNCFN